MHENIGLLSNYGSLSIEFSNSNVLHTWTIAFDGILDPMSIIVHFTDPVNSNEPNLDLN